MIWIQFNITPLIATEPKNEGSHQNGEEDNKLWIIAVIVPLVVVVVVVGLVVYFCRRYVTPSCVSFQGWRVSSQLNSLPMLFIEVQIPKKKTEFLPLQTQTVLWKQHTRTVTI